MPRYAHWLDTYKVGAMRKPGTALVVTALAAMAMSACSGGGDAAGETEETLVVGVDLPFQGASKKPSDVTVEAMRLYLEQSGGKAGRFRIELKLYDNSTAEKGTWDEAVCQKNAREHVANAAEVAVMGPVNSGCAQAQTPILAAGPGGPMLMVSHGNTYPGLTKRWEDGEPEKYQPGGVRAYARVITSDDYQGSTGAEYAVNSLGLSRCFVLNDGESYGRGAARAFTGEAKRRGIAIVGEESWDPKQAGYADLFARVKAAKPDCVYLAGVSENNGIQLIRDKVKALGDNNLVKLFAPDGFTGRPQVSNLPEAQGMYLTFAGVSAETLRDGDGNAARFLRDYKARYGRELDDSYALYGVQALQVIMAAIAESDGTRKGVHAQVLAGEGTVVRSADAVLGKDIRIDPATGDVSAHDVTVLQLRGSKEIVLNRPA